jgi:ribosome-associated protein
MPLSERKKPDPLSKSQVKRDMLALQDLGKTLVELPEVQLKKIPLPDELREAIVFARNMKANEGKRRQMQYIGKLMRESDPLPIQAALDALRQEKKKTQTQFHKMEEWRDQLIAEGDSALQKFIEAYPQADRQQLRQLLRNAQQDQLKDKNTGAATELFKYLRSLLQSP